MKFFKNLKKKHDEKNEQDAREKVLEELFNDFNRSRFAIYRLNFVRGIFFGLGSVLGGTVVLALLIWILTSTAHFIPGVADSVNDLVHVLQSGNK
jgi:hypothetical protein